MERIGENEDFFFLLLICVKLDEDSRMVKQCLKIKNSIDGCGRRSDRPDQKIDK